MMSSPAAAGAIVTIATVAGDQASKLYLLFGYDLPGRDSVHLGPFVTFTALWNKGISYGLFQQESAIGRILLIGVSVAACIALAIWIARSGNRLLAVSLGLVLGGAIGNLVDRVAYGAVFDFVHLHAGSFSWYVFNVADAAIVFGVIGLIYDALVADRQRPRAA